MASALICAGAPLLFVGACAESSGESPPASEVADAALPPPASEPKDAEVDAGACTGDDCAYFPAECAADALCPAGPFASTTSPVALDPRTTISVIRGRSASDVWAAGNAGTVARFDGAAWTSFDIASKETQAVLWLLDGGEISFRTGADVRQFYSRQIDPGDAGPASVDGWSRRPMPSGFGGALNAAWSRPGTDTLWAATASTLKRLRFTPPSSIEVDHGVSPELCALSRCDRVRSIHGASANTVWAVGDHGTAVRITEANTEAPSITPFNSQTWVSLAAVWAASDTDVWAVGGPGVIRHYTGHPTRWDVVPDLPTSESLNAVWGTSATDIWAVGDAGVVFHYDGTQWERVKVAGLGARRPDLVTVWSPEPGHVWVGGRGVVLSLGGKP